MLIPGYENSIILCQFLGFIVKMLVPNGQASIYSPKRQEMNFVGTKIAIHTCILFVEAVYISWFESFGNKVYR